MRKARTIVGLVLLAMVIVLLPLVAACGEEETTTTTAAPASTESTAPASTESTAPAGTETTAPASTASTAAGPTETLRVGVILQLTDWYSAVDALEKTDIEACAKMINDEGGVKVQGKSYMIELVEEDGKTSLDGNTAAANKLVLDEKVQFVIGPAAFFNVATTPIFEPAKVLHVASYNGLQPGEMGPDTPYEFLGLDPVAQQDVNLKALKQLYPEVKKVLCASEDATWPYFEEHLMPLIEKNGFTNAGDPVLFATQAEDYNPIATKIKGINPDALWIPISIVPSSGAIVKGLRTLGWEGPIVWSNYAPTTIAVVGPEASRNLINTLSVAYNTENSTPVINKILSIGDPNRQWFGMAPNGLYMLKHAIEAADSLDPTAVRDKWESLEMIPTVYGDGFPSGDQLYGLHHHAWAYPCAVTLINNGQIEYKGWIKPDPTP